MRPDLVDRLGFPRGRYTFRYGASGFIRSVGIGIYYPFSVIYFHHQLDRPVVQIGLGLTIASVVGALGVGRVGPLVDRLGARNTVVVSALLRAAIFAVYPLTHDLWLFLVLASLMMLAMRSDQVAGQAIVNGLAGTGDRSSWFALNRMTLNAGIGIGVMAGGIALSSSSAYQLLVLFNAVCYLVVAAFYVTFPSFVVPQVQRERTRSVWQDRLFVGVAAFSGLWLVVGLAVEVGLPVYLVLYLKQPAWTVSMVFLVNTALVTVFQLSLTRAIRDKPVTRMFGLGLVAYAAAFLVFAVRIDDRRVAIAVLLAAVTIFTLGEMIVAVTGMMMVNGLAPADRVGAYVGISHLFAGIGSAAAPFLFTAGLDLSPTALWLGLAALALGMTLMALRLSRRVTDRMAERAEEARGATQKAVDAPV